ncbi:at hook motif [Caudoviricetes sp.]|nr:at hook motif [Caudoviricetes sp.]UOF81547.1 at hook motif [Caudoviricetes sp.]
MQIEMTRDFHVAEDGFTVVLWPENSIHDTIDQLASDLIAAGVARPVAGHFDQDCGNFGIMTPPKRRGRPPKDKI